MKEIEALIAKIEQWATEIEDASQGWHAGVNATLQEMRSTADALSSLRSSPEVERHFDWECDTCHIHWKGAAKPCPKCGGKNFIHRYGSNTYELREPFPSPEVETLIERVKGIERLTAGIRAERKKPNQVDALAVAIQGQLRYLLPELASLRGAAEKPQHCARPDGCNTPVTCKFLNDEWRCGDERQFGKRELRGQPGGEAARVPAPPQPEKETKNEKDLSPRGRPELIPAWGSTASTD